MPSSTLRRAPRALSGPEFYPYRAQVLKDDFGGTYNKYITKVDVVWIGDQVRITEAIRSNGGDVFIFARELEIAAPIDTRVAIDTYGPYWNWGYVPPELIWAHTDFDFPLAVANPPWKAYNDLRFWEDSFDSSLGIYRFQGKGSYEYTTISALKSGRPLPQDTVIPLFPIANYQLPSGNNAAVPYAEGKHFGNGADAPDIADRSATRSGNIYVMAASITIGGKNTCWVKSPDGDVFDFDRPVFLQAGGLKGGRGGAGSIHPSLVDGGLNGLSGKCGRGGDAGSVFIHFIHDHEGRAAAEAVLASDVQEIQLQILTKQLPGDTNFDPKLIRSIAWFCNVIGGFPPYWGARLRTAPTTTIPSAKSRTDLSSAVERVNDGPLSDAIGTHGSITFSGVTYARALELFSQALQILDLRLPQNLSLQIEVGTQFANTVEEVREWSADAKEDQKRRDKLLEKMLRIRSSTASRDDIRLSARDQFVGFLEYLLVEAELRFISVALGEDSASSELLVDEIGFEELRTRSASFSDVEQDILLVLASFKAVPGLSAVQSYFLNVGGIYAEPSTENIHGRNYLEDEIRLLGDLNTRLNDLIDQTVLARQETLFSWAKYFDEEYESLIVTLKQKIAAIYADNAEKHSESYQLTVLWGAAQQAVGDLAEAVATDNYAALGRGLVKLGVACYTAISQQLASPEQLEIELAAVEAAYKKFVAATNRSLEAMVGERATLLENALMMERQYKSTRRTDWLRFEKLARAIFQSYLEQGRREQLYKENLLGLRTLIADPTTALPLEVTPSLANCVGQIPRRLSAGDHSLTPSERLPCVDLAEDALLLYVSEVSAFSRVPILSFSGRHALWSDLTGSQVEVIPRGSFP